MIPGDASPIGHVPPLPRIGMNEPRPADPKASTASMYPRVRRAIRWRWPVSGRHFRAAQASRELSILRRFGLRLLMLVFYRFRFLAGLFLLRF